MGKFLWKKEIALGIAFLFFCLAVGVSTAGQKTNVRHDVVPSDGFGLHSVLNIEWSQNATYDPLPPDSTLRLITLNITYWTTHGPFFYRMILLYCQLTHQTITVNLDVRDTPSWCTATLQNTQLPFLISETQVTQHTTLLVAVDEHAPAFEPFLITLYASVDTMIGPFGLLPFVYGFEIDRKIGFVPGYRAQITVTPESNFLETTPGTSVTDLITVENLGNGKTLVNIQIVDLPQNWVVIIDPSQLILEMNERKITRLIVTPPFGYYGVATILLSFTPRSYYHPEYTGEPHFLHIVVEVKP
ncbi:hypothetical protein AYK25_02700 [Thermoplasmatales archaeon SM1-50]|nr:MAG: hypothetical protein AYK25_02700 [Thermoplasmatales archaeon SM1-50]